MRNLKRVLSLALASVMLLGMMVIGAGAADYTDTDSISQKEAAQVMEAIGVMQGNDKNEFLPTAELTREAAAKIITYLLLGKTTADGLTTGKAPYSDVEAGRWSAGSIAYCASQGIISGDGKGNFFPTMTVTGTQFAKMLLGALGYKADVEGYTGSDYVQNIAKAVVATKIHNGVSSNLSSTLTREEAARMALNTLNARLVQYTGGVKVPTDQGIVEVGATRSYVEGEGSTPGKLVYQDFKGVYQTNLKYKEGTAGTYGRPSHTWTLGKTEVGTYGNDVDVTFTASTKKADVKDALSGYSRDGHGDPVKDAVVTINGVSSSKKINDTAVNDGLQVIADLTGAGRLVEVYANSNYEITDIVVVDQVLAEISTINTSAKEVRIVTKSFSGALPGETVAANQIVGGQTLVVKESDNKTLYAKLAEMKVEDYVLVTFDGAKVASVAMPESFTGTFTAESNTGKRTIGGNSYDDSYAAKNFVAGGTDTTAIDMTPGNDYIVYLDTYGNTIYAKADATSNLKYAYLADAATEGSKVNGNVTYSVKLLFTDGTQQWVKVGSYNDEAAKVSNATFTAAFDQLAKGHNLGFVSYNVRADGSYTLMPMVNEVGKTRTQTFSSSKIDKDKVNFLDTDTSIMGNSKTVFLVASSDSTYKAYTGIKNIPGWKNVEGTILFAANNSKIASVVMVTTPGAVNVETDYVYLLKDKGSFEYVDGQTIYTYDAVVNGKIGTIKMTKACNDSDVGTVGAYGITKYSGDYVAALTKVTNNHTVAGEYASYDVTQLTNADGLKVNTFTYKNGVFTDVTNSAVYMEADNVTVIGYSTAAKTAYEIPASQIASYWLTNYVILMDSDSMAATVVFTY